MLANMNSNHSGGTNVVDCDGHGGFLSERRGVTTATGGSITVYQVLVTPDGTKNGEPPADESHPLRVVLHPGVRCPFAG